MLRITIFLKSLFWHIYSGSPKSTLGQILERYVVCKTCDKFDQENSKCNVCGCNVNVKKQFFNKLAWADQECPLGKWKSIIKG